jgi:hypothetical protein
MGKCCGIPVLALLAVLTASKQGFIIGHQLKCEITGQNGILRKEVINMTENAKRAIVWLVFAAGLILGIVGWTTSAYASSTGTIIFLCFLFACIALRILWGFKRRDHRTS